MDFIQLVMTNSVAGLRRSSKTLPKGKLVPKKGHGHCLIVGCRSDPVQLSECHWSHYIWEVCSTSWWDAPKTAMPVAGIGQQKGPNSPWQYIDTCHTTNTSKVEWIDRWSLSHLPCSPDLWLTDYHFFKYLNNCLQGKHFCN